MSKYEKWSGQPTRFLSMTGYCEADFASLLPHFEAEHDRYLQSYNLNGKKKTGSRRSVIYKNSPLPTHAERLCFILYYYKHNPIQEALADVFDMDQGQCNEFIHGLSVILRKTLERVKAMPARSDLALQSLLNSLEEKELLHDGTEREVPRPKDFEEQNNLFSGKKKRHALKNAVIATMLGFVLYLSPSCAGRVHDKRLAEAYTIPWGYVLWQDTGYQGYAPDGVLVIQPMKKAKGGELSDEQRHMNRSISSVRVRIEHFIGGIKRYRIVKDECRAYKNNFRDAVMAICTGLYNFRIMRNPPKYADNQLI